MALASIARVAGACSLMAVCLGCAEGPNRPDTDQSCQVGKNLMQDTSFDAVDGNGEPWLYTQHAGERSFALSSNAGTLQIERVSGQPWMLLQQTIESSEFSGATVRFSAELKGDAPAQPRIHGFEHKAGLYLNIGFRKDPISADHEPNSGVWDWQTVAVERLVPAGETQLHVGFLHQSGGTLWISEPELLITECAPQ